jgi:hypothetical protein
MVFIIVPGMCGWGNLYLRCQAPGDPLHGMEEVCGRLFYCEVPSARRAPAPSQADERMDNIRDCWSEVIHAARTCLTLQ